MSLSYPWVLDRVVNRFGGVNGMVMESPLVLLEKGDFEDSQISKEVAGILEPGVKENQK